MDAGCGCPLLAPLSKGQVEFEKDLCHRISNNLKRPVQVGVRGHGRGGGNFRLAELLPSVPGAGRTSQTAGQARAECAQMVCDGGDRTP
jgi:hypothetical protein